PDVQVSCRLMESLAQQGGAAGVEEGSFTVDVVARFLARSEDELAERQSTGSEQFQQPLSGGCHLVFLDCAVRSRTERLFEKGTATASVQRKARASRPNRSHV